VVRVDLRPRPDRRCSRVQLDKGDEADRGVGRKVVAVISRSVRQTQIGGGSDTGGYVVDRVRARGATVKGHRLPDKGYKGRTV